MRRLAVFVSLLALPGLAVASNIGMASKKLVVLDKLARSGKAKFVYVATAGTGARVSKGSGNDLNQISVQFDVAYANGSSRGAFILPAGGSNGTHGWIRNRYERGTANLGSFSDAEYVNKEAPDGPTQTRTARIKAEFSVSRIKLAAKGLGDVPLDLLGSGAPGQGGVQTAFCITNGGEEFCHCSDMTECAYKLVAGGTGAKLVCRGPLHKRLLSSWACPARCQQDLVDLGLTVFDPCTNLEWEKKDTAVGSGMDAANLHDVDNLYTWAGRCTINTETDCQPNAAAAANCVAQTGSERDCTECAAGDGTCDVDPFGLGAITTIWDWIDQINESGYAGHSDWRIPESKDPPELASIIDLAAPGCLTGSACIAPIFGPTGTHYYATRSGTRMEFETAIDYSRTGFGPAFPRLVRAVRSAP